MKILRNLEVPTGNILVVQGEKGKLEMLSLGDYGKGVNVKADFMGLSRELGTVQHTRLLPLEEKWVITISTQYGCSMNCQFCDVPKVGPGKNATYQDLIDQVITGIDLHPEVRSTKRLNIHFARMGEPTWNHAVLDATRQIHAAIGFTFKIHPVVSTMMPWSNRNLLGFIRGWMDIKNNLLSGEAGLQFSINSTDEQERVRMFSGNAGTLKAIGEVMEGIKPVGRKITLNFAIAGYTIDPDVLLRHFSPDDYLIKLTPMHKTLAAINNGIETDGDYTQYHPYQKHESQLKAAGYDVLVFIASVEEDLGRITCGNAILSGTLPGVEYKELAPGCNRNR
jgi:23S rRNA (adenine2503-C2)-methyltransferase